MRVGKLTNGKLDLTQHAYKKIYKLDSRSKYDSGAGKKK
jgi:hypothetical protein